MEDAKIRLPGLWLEEDLTKQESADFLTFAEIVDVKPKSKDEAEKIFEKAAPYMNAFMHMLYKLEKKHLPMQAVEDGVKRTDKENTYIDFVSYTADYAAHLFGWQILPKEVNQNEDLPLPVSVVSTFPENLLFTTSLESRKLFQGTVKPAAGTIKDGDLIPVHAGDIKRGSDTAELTNKIGISFARLEQEGIHVEHLEPEDEAIHNALLSLWAAGNDIVSIPMIYRTIAKDKGKQPTEIESQMIIDSIERMRKTDVVYDNMASAKAYNQPAIRANANLIHAETVQGSLPELGQNPDKDCVIINGKLIKFYVHLYGNRPFPMYEWAKAKNQVQSYPMCLLVTDINKNKTTISLENALIWRITAMKNQKNKTRISNKIVYENLFDTARLLTQQDGKPYKATTLQKRKSQLKTYTRRILDSFVKNGFIKSYTEEKKGKTVTGVIIKP